MYFGSDDHQETFTVRDKGDKIIKTRYMYSDLIKAMSVMFLEYA